METLLASVFALFLAYANGANDNFKGVATLWGSGVTDFKGALGWATVTTVAGSVCALFLAQGLLVSFSGKGLVPDSLLAMPSFALSVALAAAVTVMLATLLGLPISTTHALTGALVGVGMMSPEGVNFSRLWTSFAQPLLVAPILGGVGAFILYPIFRYAHQRSGIRRETCVCVGQTVVASFAPGTSSEQALAAYQSGAGGVSLPTVGLGSTASCRERYQGHLIGINVGATIDTLHFLSAGVVGFARGLNDTPKIAALLLAGAALSPTAGIVSVGLFMIVGGLLNSRKVAETMAHNVTAMNGGQGLTANLVTGALVISASKFGLPVSTTHVSCGALFGIGAVTGQARWKTIANIFLAWVTTLPLAGAVGAIIFRVMSA